MNQNKTINDLYNEHFKYLVDYILKLENIIKQKESEQC
jgi:hypothetical protein